MSLRKIVCQSRTWLSTLVVIATVAGCGGGSTQPDPLQVYRQQTLNWTACDPNVAGPRSPKVLEAWERAGDRLQCSTMRVPMEVKTIQLRAVPGEARKAVRCWLPRDCGPTVNWVEGQGEGEPVSMGVWAAEAVKSFDSVVRAFMRDGRAQFDGDDGANDG